MYHSHNKSRDDGRSRGYIGRSPPRRRRSPEGGNKFCMYCKVQISSQRLYDEHCASAVHKQKEILISKALSDGLQYCYTCEKIFPTKLALDAHCLMTRHKPLYRVEELQPKAGNKSVNVNNLIQVVQTPQQNDTESRRAREDKEREDIVMKLKEVRGTEEGDDKAQDVSDERRVISNVKCDICDVDCMTYSNYKIHIESWRHRSEVDKKDDKQKKVDARKKFEEEAEKTFDAAEEADRRRVPENITGKAGYFCEVCSIASANEVHYLEHLKTRNHFRKVGQMRRPYKCYFCELEFNVAKDFTYHLESQPHMDKAFQRVKDDNKSKKSDKGDEWIEKKTDKHESRSKDSSRDSRKDDRISRKDDHHNRKHGDKKGHSSESRSKDGKKDTRKAEVKEKSPKSADCRKVEIIDSPTADSTTGIKDLREKLKAQKIIITKANSPEKPVEEDNPTTEEEEEEEDTPTFLTNPGEAEKLDQFEQEFETKFKELMKECSNDKAALQERLTKDREEDINAYQKYEEDFKELQEEEDFIRNNIEKLEDGDPCKEDFIIDIIRVQRKMEDLRQQMEVKEMMIIKREILYRKYFPEKGEEKDAPQTEGNKETKKPSSVYEYNHGSGKEDAKEKTSVPEADKSNNTSGPSTTDLRIKLERERLLKRLGPELEGVDPALREKLLSVIMEKDPPAESSTKSSNNSKTGDTRQVLKDDSSHSRQTQMDLLTKREKELEVELANLKSNAMASVKKKKSSPKATVIPKKTAPKSLVPQYDDVDDKKKKDTKKKTRKRSLSTSSISSMTSTSSSAFSDAERKIKKKRKKSPSKARVKSRTGSGTDKSRRKRRSASRDRAKKKSIASKRSKDEDKKKKTDRSKTEKKKSVKSRDKGSKVVTDNKDNDSDVQEIIPIPIQTISVIGSASTAPLNSQTSSVTTDTMATSSASTLVVPKEQFSFWKSSAQAKVSPKDDIWDSAFSGGQEDTVVSSTINLFDPASGKAQLPEDILNILKSVAPIIQQNNQHSSPLKVKTPAVVTPASPAQPYNNVSPLKKKDERLNDQPVNQVEDTTTKIRSILKKVTNPLQNIQRDLPRSLPSSVIPGLAPISAPQSSSMSTLDYSAPPASRIPGNFPSPATSRRSDNVGKSILKQPSSYVDSKISDTDRSLYDQQYSSAGGGGPTRYGDQKEDYMQNKDAWEAREYYSDPSRQRYDSYETKQNGGNDARLQNDWQDQNMPRKDIAPAISRPYNDYQYSNHSETQRHMPGDNLTDYKRQDSVRPNEYSNVDNFRQPSVPMERGRPDHVPPSHFEGSVLGNVPSSTAGSYPERNSRPTEPYVRSEVTHRVIDYTYVTDTRVHPDEKIAPPKLYNDDIPKQPVRYPGETDDEYYSRFERFYEVTQRKETARTGEYPPRNSDDPRSKQDMRHPPPPSREDLYRPSDRLVPVESYSYERGAPTGRVESVRRVENMPLDERDRILPYRREEIVESRYTTEMGSYRGYRHTDYPPRDNRQDAYRQLPTQHRLPPSSHLLSPPTHEKLPPRQPQSESMQLGDFVDY